MKCLTLYLHSSVEREVLDRLRDLRQVSGFTLTECQGHSTSTADDPFVGTRDRVAGFVPRIRIELVLADEDVEPVLGEIRASLPGERSMGAWTVSDLSEFGRL